MKTISDIKSEHITGSEAEGREHLKKLYEASKRCFNHRGYL